MDWVTLATSAGTSIATTFISNKSDDGPIKLLNDIWYLTFGNFHHHVAKNRAQHDVNLQHFTEKIVNNLSDIPVDERIEPRLNVLGPTLENAKYYIEDIELREMFANLISSTLDGRHVLTVHPSFVEIIKQLSPLDAQNIALFKHAHFYPVAKFSLITPSSVGGNIFNHVFLSNDNCNNLQLISSSLTNLERLGLISIDYNQKINGDHFYDKFEKHPEYQKMLGMFNSAEYQNFSEHLIGIIPDAQQMRPKITRGIVSTTQFGKDFIKSCVY